MKWAVIVLMQPNGFVMKYEKINISHLGIYYSCIDVNDNTQEDAYEELSHNDTLSRIQVEYDTENRRKWNGQML